MIAEASRTEPGNLSFVAYRQIDDDREIVLLERYVSREAFAVNRETRISRSLCSTRSRRNWTAT
jgi:quinol monooxygenase YgiN